MALGRYPSGALSRSLQPSGAVWRLVKPFLQAIEIRIDDRCGVEGYHPAERQPSNHGESKRPAKFATGAMT
jgi:hypothetical protein